MKKFLIAFRIKYYLAPAVYAVLFTILAGVFIKIDYYSNALDKIPLFIHSASGNNVLIIIISGLVAVVTVKSKMLV